MNKVKFGLNNVVIAPITYGENNSITYGEVFSVPGAVNLTLDQAGDTTDFYADNTKYFTSAANQGYTGSLEMALITDEFKKKIFGMSEDANGVMAENKDDKVNDFALGFIISGDSKKTKYWFLQVSAQRPSVASQTIETAKTPITETLNITASARITDGEVKFYCEEGKAAYASFFNSVYTKEISE
ncbi:MAG: major tail protein [Methanosphaera sp.]|nr:major tail protein [Methanosphaera sp.]